VREELATELQPPVVSLGINFGIVAVFSGRMLQTITRPMIHTEDGLVVNLLHIELVADDIQHT